ncbi:hypothetical protein C8R46DRAFT_838881, partial [Mycena filopes]
KGFSTDGRPVQVHTWIKGARKGKPRIVDSAKFGREWKGWWRGLNPEWRFQGSELVKEGKGPWDAMRKPGANGFLGVLAALKWWGEEGGVTADWSAAVADVSWV